ncbi:XRE family transcriptional regulator [Cupriavidus necator]|uniref:helix-turn-helix domain-containing protein n=1 Tax=Cupriavidus necator TaxID=106590 RepID=UPI0014904684|nr:helix-turn-helix transcriptional regulator [Cupriavidus necator]NOV24176.1 XRE family transcriptional regulator [Cupriavidus necator]
MHAHGSTPFGERLKQARRERGMDLETFADRVGVAVCMVTGYENRGRVPRLDSLIAMAQVLDCSLDWLCGLEN